MFPYHEAGFRLSFAPMDPDKLRALLEQLRRGDVSVDDTVRELANLPYKDLGFARVDHHRHLRTGFPEVVLGLGKTAEQIGHIMAELQRTGSNLLAPSGPAARRGRTPKPWCECCRCLATSSPRAPSSSSRSRSRRSDAAPCSSS